MRFALALALLFIVPVVSACGAAPVEVADRTVKVACGACIFHMPDAKGCYWAAEIDGTYYWVQGVEPQDMTVGHAPDGMCTMPREAVVDGRLEGDHLVVTSWDLLPATGVAPAGEHPHTH